MRPWLLGPSPTDAEAPALFAYEPGFRSRRGPVYPVLARSRGDAQRVMRQLAGVPGVDTGDWRTYDCERLRSVWEKLLVDLQRGDGVTRFKTDLERRFSEELEWLEHAASGL